jgi:hypothetical protein
MEAYGGKSQFVRSDKAMSWLRWLYSKTVRG